ncbi:MAG: chemotaxis protein CheW, partial [Desulfatirhabdiaceae bacterium]
MENNPSDRGEISTIEGKYLTFTLGQEEYGIGIKKIREIIGLMPITAIPEMPAYIKGVINLRGRVIPVVDLRLRFSMPEIDYTERTCIVVVEMESADGHATIGIVVDAVS